MKSIFTSLATVIGPVLLIIQFQSCSETPAGARSTSSHVSSASSLPSQVNK